MKLIIGLGNPGKKYEKTRHNVGFLALDKVAEELEKKSGEKLGFSLEKKFDAEIAKLRLGKEDMLLVKPQTFMNKSGVSVKKLVDFYKLNPPQDIIIVYDDIDIPVGATRIRFKGSSGGHNGLQSIIESLATEGFMRVRIGIGRPENDDIKIEDWVLQNLSEEDTKTIEKAIESLIGQGLEYLSA